MQTIFYLKKHTKVDVYIKRQSLKSRESAYVENCVTS